MRRAVKDMKITPTLFSAALAGAFSALAWPVLWPLVSDPRPSSSAWLVAGTLLFIALPAHAFVVGIGHSQAQAGHAIDIALLKRTAAWLAAASVVAGIIALYRASPLAA